jgi:TatA/E family protein of Tat protein translocase
MHYLLFFEFLGTSELLVVLFVALIIFGPRKLPELGRSLGQALNQVRNVSNDFKRTWETEALVETVAPAALTPAASAEHVIASEAHAELVPGDDAPMKSLASQEAHAPLHEALVPINASYASPEATFGESRS